MSRCAYDILALDLDGTLLRPDGTVSEANAAAVRRAREAGLRVTVCTGRGLVESARILDAIGQTDPVVVAGGSILACPRTRTTLHRFAMDPRLIADLVAALNDAGYPALVLKDPQAARMDYFVVTGDPPLELDPVTEWWFAELGCTVRLARSIDDDEHPEHTVRVGACGRMADLAGLRARLESIAGPRGVLHHFPAVISPDHAAASHAKADRIDILEVFDAEASKWNAIRWLAAEWGMHAPRVAAIGDEINDVAMIRGAALGVAMGNAVPEVMAVADRVTGTNREDGVAQAIERILAGAW